MTAVAIRKAIPTDLPQLYVFLRGKAEFNGASEALTASEYELRAAIA
jgi:hypothetical protein